MTYGTGTSYDFSSLDRGYLSRQAAPHAVSGAVALGLSILVGACILYAHSATMHYAASGATTFDEATPVAAPVTARVVYEAPSVAPTMTIPASHEAPAGTPAALLDSTGYVALLDPTYSLDFVPASVANSAPLASTFQSTPPAHPTTVVEKVVPVPPMPPVAELVQSVPLPAPRPPEFEVAPPRVQDVLAPASHSAPRTSGRAAEPHGRTVVVPVPPADHRSFFDKLFGMARSPGSVLAYASPEDDVIGDRRSVAVPVPYDRLTAIYDIAAHTVYLPDGTRLEAHSGYGSMLDDPRYVNQKMRGATPPDVYELQPREQLFHGVQALRLIPVGSGNVYGRTGLLAHTFMLGPRGDSNGCVSFRNYQAFLRAYANGEIKRLAVVARL